MNAEPTSASIYLKKVANWDGTSQDINQALVAAFEAKDYLDCIKDLRARNIEPLSYINGLDKASSYSIPRQWAWLNDLATDHRWSSNRFRTTKTMHTSVEEDVWLIWNPSRFLRSYPRAQQAWPATVRVWWIL